MSWWWWGQIPARYLLKLDEVADSGELLFVTDADARFPYSVYQLDTGDADHIYPIPYHWSTPWLDMGSPLAVKQFQYLNIDFDGYDGGVTVAWSVDSGAASGNVSARVPNANVWGDSTDHIKKLWNDAAGSQPNGLFWTEDKVRSVSIRLPQQALGRRIQFTFSSENSGLSPAIFINYTVVFTVRQQLYPSRVEA